MKAFFQLSLLVLFCSAPGVATAQWHGPDAPDSLSFQGFMTDSSGVAITTTADITFKLYKGNTAVWSQTKSGVQLTDGVFNVILGGTGGASLDTVAFNEPIDLEIKYGNLVMSPRTPLTSAAYALGMRGMYAVDSNVLNSHAPNLIGGASNNYVANDVAGATISGGGGWFVSTSLADSVLANWGTIGGGNRNVAGAEYATVAGGRQNRALGAHATVGGGRDNTATGSEATVGGGERNTASLEFGTVGGGDRNTASGQESAISGGRLNSATGQQSTIGGGGSNRAFAAYTTVGGGVNNEASDMYASVVGGQSNFATASHSIIGGGIFNEASGRFSAVPGGRNNRASGGFSFAAGQGAQADHSGSFVWADSASQFTAVPFASTDENQFLIRAQGGVGIGTNAPDAQLDVAGPTRSSGAYSSTVLYKNTNGTGNPDGDGFRLRYDGDFFGSNADGLVIEKADGNGSTPDGGIAFVNTGSDGVVETSLAIRGNGRVGIGTSTPDRLLHVRGSNGVVRVDRDTTNGATVLLLHQYESGGGTGVKTFSLGVDANGPTSGIFEIKDHGTATSGSGSVRLKIANNGDITIPGNLSKGGGSFKIDHPLDPENKYLYHSFVESPDMMNVYNGNTILNESGAATIELPSYFEALNKDFRYQLTAIGAPGPNLHVAKKISGNQFSIEGGLPGMEVSWQITGVRKDPYAEQHRIEVEVDKQPQERGTYLHPDVYTGTN